MELFGKLSSGEEIYKLTVSNADVSLSVIEYGASNFLNDRIIKGGNEIHRRYRLCLETQYFPNSVNIPDFPSTLLKAGETDKSRTDYRFKFRD